MALFEDVCEDKDSFFEVYVRLTSVPVTQEQAPSLYEFIANVRKLRKPFHFHLDARKARFNNYLPFIPQILIEAKKGGVSKCLSTEIVVPDRPMVREIFKPIIESVRFLTYITLTPVPE